MIRNACGSTTAEALGLRQADRVAASDWPGARPGWCPARSRRVARRVQHQAGHDRAVADAHRNPTGDSSDPPPPGVTAVPDRRATRYAVITITASSTPPSAHATRWVGAPVSFITRLRMIHTTAASPAPTAAAGGDESTDPTVTGDERHGSELRGSRARARHRPRIGVSDRRQLQEDRRVHEDDHKQRRVRCGASRRTSAAARPDEHVPESRVDADERADHEGQDDVRRSRRGACS